MDKCTHTCLAEQCLNKGSKSKQQKKKTRDQANSFQKRVPLTCSFQANKQARLLLSGARKLKKKEENEAFSPCNFWNDLSER